MYLQAIVRANVRVTMGPMQGLMPSLVRGIPLLISRNQSRLTVIHMCLGHALALNIRLLEPGAYSLNVGGLVAVSWHLAVGKLIYIYIYIHMHNMLLGMYACMHACMHVCMYVCMYICMCMYYVYAYVYVYVYVYVYNVVKTCN